MSSICVQAGTHLHATRPPPYIVNIVQEHLGKAMSTFHQATTITTTNPYAAAVGESDRTEDLLLFFFSAASVLDTQG